MVMHDADSPQVLKIAAGNSSPTSADNFRQIDDVFLQTQTRIWLGEVLRTRLNEQLSIADLLADGELLFEVSREVWKMMLSKRLELKCLKAYEYEPFASRNSGRYMPYSYVDSFLKICKILGMDGIDLFSPSDVVEKRDTRKVCMCIRALSMKARSVHLNVPDFDIVTYTLAMPTDMVGYIRRSWELSHFDYANSSSLNPHQNSRQRSRQEHSKAISERNHGLSFEEFDDTEINSMPESDSSATNFSYKSSFEISSELIMASGVSSVVKHDSLDVSCVQLDVESQEEEESIKCQAEEVCSNELEGSFFSHQLECDHQQDNMASPSVVDSNSQLGDSVFNAESGGINSYRSNVVDLIYINPFLKHGASVAGDSLQCSTPESTITDDQQAVSATMGNGTYTSDSILLDEKNNIFNARLNSGSCCSKATVILENEFTSQSFDGDDVEVCSVGSVNSRSVIRNLDFDDHLEAEDALKNACFSETKIGKLDGMSMKLTEGLKSQDTVKCKTSEQIVSTNNKEESLHMRGMDIGLSSPKCVLASSDVDFTGYIDHAMPYDKNICMSQINSNVGDGEEKELFAAHSCFSHGFSHWDQKGKCRIAVEPIENDGCESLSLSPSLVDSNEENHEFIKTEVTEDALRHKKIKSIVADAVKLDPHGCEQPTTCSDNIINGSHKDLSDSCNMAENLNVNKDEGRIHELQISAVEQTDDRTTGIAASKPQKRPFLKAVVSGTAAVGAMFLLLHFRKNGRENSGESGKQAKQSNRVRSANGVYFSSAKGHSAQRLDGTYPAEKLKLGQR